jgi:hypothetical protein
MKKAITVTVNNPLNYFRGVVDQLCDLKPQYDIFISVEPKYTNALGNSFLLESMRRLLEFTNVKLILQREQLGVKEHPFQLLNAVFDEYDYVCYLEEDLDLAADVFNLSDWFEDYGDENCICTCFYNRFSVAQDAPHHPNRLVMDRYFKALGFALHKRSWIDVFKPMWHEDRRGWDWSIFYYLYDRFPEKYLLIPDLARATHKNTEGGTHFRTNQHWSDYENIVLNQDPTIRNYFVDATPRQYPQPA